jgi:hypothetical protein
MKPSLRLLLLSCASLGLAGALAAQPPTAPAALLTSSASSGFDYSTGKYGFTESTEVYSVPLDLSHENGAWLWRANFSYLTIKGPATIVGGGGAARPTSNSESGFGDIYLSGAYRFGELLGPWHLDVTARVKLPTASEARGLGTGETDFYGQADIYRSFGSVTPFFTAGWREFGTSAQYQLNSGVYASAGVHFRLSEATLLITSFDWGEELLAGEDDTMDVLAAVSHEVNANWRAMVYALAGLTDASPDFAIGVRATYRF